jgi:hypothetical protein
MRDTYTTLIENYSTVRRCLLHAAKLQHRLQHLLYKLDSNITVQDYTAHC